MAVVVARAIVVPVVVPAVVPFLAVAISPVVAVVVPLVPVRAPIVIVFIVAAISALALAVLAIIVLATRRLLVMVAAAQVLLTVGTSSLVVFKAGTLVVMLTVTSVPALIGPGTVVIGAPLGGRWGRGLLLLLLPLPLSLRLVRLGGGCLRRRVLRYHLLRHLQRRLLHLGVCQVGHPRLAAALLVLPVQVELVVVEVVLVSEVGGVPGVGRVGLVALVHVELERPLEPRDQSTSAAVLLFTLACGRTAGKTLLWFGAAVGSSTFAQHSLHHSAHPRGITAIDHSTPKCSAARFIFKKSPEHNFG